MNLIILLYKTFYEASFICENLNLTYIKMAMNNNNKEEVSSLVFDYGSYKFSFGFNGDDYPKYQIGPYIGLNRKDDSILYGQNDILSTDENTMIFNIINQSGFIENYELFENFIDNFYSNILNTDSKSFPVLFSEPPLHNKEFRYKLTEIMFEKMQIPGFFMTKSSVLSSFSCGKSTSLVVDSGHNSTYVSVVQDGYVNQKTLCKSELGGSYLTSEIVKSLENRQIDFLPKGKLNQVNVDESHFRQFLKKEIGREIKETCFILKENPVNNSSSNYFNFKDDMNNNQIETKDYQLPDGSKISLEPEKHIIEKIFTQVKDVSGFYGIHKMAIECIFKCELDSRKEIYQNIIVTGGNTSFQGFNDRLQKNIFLNSPQNIKTRVIDLLSNNHKSLTSFLGGSILSSLGSFNQLWISQQDYSDYGPFIIEKKCV